MSFKQIIKPYIHPRLRYHLRVVYCRLGMILSHFIYWVKGVRIDDPKDIPIIMVTARSQDDDKAIGQETGVNEYITKPFELDDLIERVNKYLKA